jgi:hypothetical protein
MASITDVASAIGRALADAAFRPVPPRKAGKAMRPARKALAPARVASKKQPTKAKTGKAASRGKPAKPRPKSPNKRQKPSKTARPQRLTK